MGAEMPTEHDREAAIPLHKGHLVTSFEETCLGGARQLATADEAACFARRNKPRGD